MKSDSTAWFPAVQSSKCRMPSRSTRNHLDPKILREEEVTQKDSHTPLNFFNTSLSVQESFLRERKAREVLLMICVFMVLYIAPSNPLMG